MLDRLKRNPRKAIAALIALVGAVTGGLSVDWSQVQACLEAPAVEVAE